MRKLIALMIGAMIVAPTFAQTAVTSDTETVTIKGQVLTYVDLVTVDGVINVGAMLPDGVNDTKTGLEALGWTSNVAATVTINAGASTHNTGVTINPSLVMFSDSSGLHEAWNGAVGAGTNVAPAGADDVDGAAYLKVVVSIDETAAVTAADATLGTVVLDING